MLCYRRAREEEEEKEERERKRLLLREEREKRRLLEEVTHLKDKLAKKHLPDGAGTSSKRKKVSCIEFYK